MATLMSSPSWAMVANSGMVIWKPPSPATTHTSASGRATLAPIAAGRAKPMVPRPPDVMSERGLVVVVLGLPHLVLADVAHHHRVAVGEPPQVVHHVRGVPLSGR